MRTILLLLLFVQISPASMAQSLKKYPVSNSGCSYYSYCPAPFTVEYSSDSSKIFRGECNNEGTFYGIICVRLLNPVPQLDQAEQLLISYAEHLKSSLHIIRAVGYGKGHQLRDRTDTRGILDYWEDNAGDKWKIKAWTDGKFIGFLYAYSAGELSEPKVNVFLDSFRLPEIK